MGINYTIVHHIATLSTWLDQDGTRWNNEVNIISWNGKEPQFDVRAWDENHERCEYGVKLAHTEVDRFYKGMTDYYKGVGMYD